MDISMARHRNITVTKQHPLTLVVNGHGKNADLWMLRSTERKNA